MRSVAGLIDMSSSASSLASNAPIYGTLMRLASALALVAASGLSPLTPNDERRLQPIPIASI